MSGERHDDWIEVAERIGARLVEAALWDGERCTWLVRRHDLTRGGTQTIAAGGDVYQGSSGIALFLGELAAATGSAQVAATAAGAVEHALAEAARRPPERFGFHGGNAGVAFVAERLGSLFDRRRWTSAAVRLLAAMAGREERDAGLDVIGGAAGGIPVLLDLGHRLGRPELTEIARRLGDHLLATARREPAGWSWGTVGPSATGNLTGWAHGTSGIAAALFELAAATGDGRYRFGAEMALLYERRLFDDESGNWPDLRHQELNRLYYEQGDDAVAAADAAGELGRYRRGFMRAWCHGSPGCGLARVRAWELTGGAIHRREAEAALASAAPTLAPPFEIGFSLCHGAAGNAELAWLAGELFGDAAAAAFAVDCAAAGRRRFELAGTPWPCGTVGAVTDPSLMLGEAGIGWFYLRLALPGLPSPLLPRPELPRAEEDDGYAALAEEWVDEAFGLSRAAFTALGVRLTADAGAALPAASPVEMAFEELRDAVGAAEGDLRPLLADAFRVERAAHEIAARPNDLTDEYLRRLRRRPPAEVDWGAARLVAHADLRLATLEHDWAGWLEARRAGGGEALPAAAPSRWLVARLGDRLTLRPAGQLAAALLAALAEGGPATAGELARRLATHLGRRDGAAVATLAARVREQAAALYAAGLLDLAAASAGDADAQPAAAGQGVAG